jgi:hypothetical protein
MLAGKKQLSMQGFENKHLHGEAKISSRRASILKQFVTALELLTRNHWSSRQLTCLELNAFKLQTIFNPCNT